MNNQDNLYEYLCKRIEQLPGANLITKSPSGSVVVNHLKSDAHEGKGGNMPIAAIGLCVGGGGPARRKDDHGELNDIWRPGRVGFVLPSSSVQGYAPPMTMLAVEFYPKDIPQYYDDGIDMPNLEAAANKLYDDPIVTSVLIAMMRDAETHGESSAFFDHGLALILQRLTGQINAEPEKVTTNGLSKLLSTVLEQIEVRLDEDLRVTEFSQQLSLSPRTFTRLFKRELGQTPYQYITSRRMKRAKYLLSQGVSVTDTALSVGFSNPAKFAATFQRWANASPSKWQLMNYR